MTTPLSDITAETAAQTALATFTRSLGAMLGANVDVLRALDVAARQAGDEELMAIVQQIRLELEDGRELGVAISRYPSHFSPFYVQMVRQGEKDGCLADALLNVAEYLENARQPVDFLTSVPVRQIALPMATLGIMALGAAIVWAAGAAEWIDGRWITPLALGWASLCLLAGVWSLLRVRHATEVQSAGRPGLRPMPAPPEPGRRRFRIPSAQRRMTPGAQRASTSTLQASGNGQASPNGNGHHRLAPPHDSASDRPGRDG